MRLESSSPPLRSGPLASVSGARHGVSGKVPEGVTFRLLVPAAEGVAVCCRGGGLGNKAIRNAKGFRRGLPARSHQRSPYRTGGHCRCRLRLSGSILPSSTTSIVPLLVMVTPSGGQRGSVGDGESVPPGMVSFQSG